jgi:MFS family permease
VPIIGIIGHPTYLQLLLVALVEGTASSLFGPAIYVMTRDILPSDQLADGLGLSQAVQAATALIGPGIGGALYGVHRLLPFAADSLSYLASAILIWRIASRPAARASKTEGRGRISDGIRWILGQRALFMIMVFATVINFVSAAIDVLVVLVLRSHGVSSGFIGLVLSCSGVGAIVGSLLSTVLVKRMSVPMLLLGIGVGWSIALGLFAAFYAPWLIAVLLVLLMTLSPAAGVIVGQALIGRAPRDLLGRVGAATSVLLSGLASVGPVLAGVIFVGLGRSGSWLTLAVLTAAITAACWVPLQATRSLKADPAAADGEPVESLATEVPPSST